MPLDELDETVQAPRTPSLRQLQSEFAVAVADLIIHADHLGYHVTFGEAWRSEEEANRLAASGAGIRRSLHQDRLAVDLNLFNRDGIFLSKTEDHRPLGEWWVKRHSLARWGGNFAGRPDGNHYSFTYGGRM